MALSTVEKDQLREEQIEHVQGHRTKRNASGVEGAVCSLKCLKGHGDQRSSLGT